MRSFLFFAAFLLVFGFTGDRKSYPEDYFRSPIHVNLRLSGTFGELRSNHFHSGIDIKGAIGQTLYAAADGYLSRIRVEKDGYGKVMYITHPNGYTTVYAHMNNFTPVLEQYIKDHQYKKKQFEVELFPSKEQFVFKKGEKIGAMGTTGSSFGPHLHFEIRDSRTEEPINPLLFGLQVADTRPPRMHQLRVYSLNDKLETLQAETHDLVWKGDHYGLAGEALAVGAWRAGFALKVYDHMDGVSNWNGIYELEAYADDELIYGFDVERFSFSETRYLNAHLDYGQQVSNRAYFNRCYRLPGNRLSIYKRQINDGVVKLYKDKPVKITMIARDIAGNESRLEFFVKRAEIGEVPKRNYNYLLPYEEANVIDNYDVRVHFPKGSFYENLYMEYHHMEDRSFSVYSEVHSLHNPETPVHRYFDLAIRPTLMPDDLKPKAFIALCGPGNRVTNCGGKWENGMLKTKVRGLGDYCIMVDETPPTIRPISFQANMKGYNKMSFKIEDNYPSSGRAKGLTYTATVDGKWILMEYDEKNDLLIHHFDGRLDPGSHELELTVSDSQYNKSVFKQKFSL